MERNFRDRVKVNDITVKYKEIEVAEIDSIEIKMGIFDLLSYLMRGKTSAEIVAVNGEVRLTQSLFDSFNSGTNDAQEEKDNVEKEAKYNFTISLENFSISLLDKWTIDGVSASVSMDERISKLNALINIPEVKLLYNDYEVGLDKVSVILNKKEAISAKLSLDSLSLASASFSLNTGHVKGNASLNTLSSINDIKGKVDIETALISIGEGEILVDPISLALDDTGASVELKHIKAQYKDIEFERNFGKVKRLIQR